MDNHRNHIDATEHKKIMSKEAQEIIKLNEEQLRKTLSEANPNQTILEECSEIEDYDSGNMNTYSDNRFVMSDSNNNSSMSYSANYVNDDTSASNHSSNVYYNKDANEHEEYNSTHSHDLTRNYQMNRTIKGEESWIEVGESSILWDSLKNNFKNIFSTEEEMKCEEHSINSVVEPTVEEIEKVTQEISELEIKRKKYPKGHFPIAIDCYVKCLNFLSVEKILECELINKITSEVINNRINVFTHIQKLNLDEKWATLSVYKRQYYLHQMKNLKYIKAFEKIFSGNGIYIHEVAAIIFQNVSNLRTLELLSPEYYMDDNTPRHEPFAFAPRCFEKLEKLTIIGCQTMEWLHIFRNCSFPMLKKFEVCYYPLHHDHWYWEFIFDFTILGLQGFFKMLYTMISLQKIVVGFDVLFDNADGDIYNPPGSLRNTLDPYSIIDNGYQQYMSGTVPPANGYPSRKFKSYRGKLCEEDFSDIFSLIYFISGKYGKLKRIMIKYRNSHEFHEDENERDETINEFLSGAANTASVCYNYVRNWFGSVDQN